MRLIFGDMFDSRTWQYSDGTPVGRKPSAIVITTNGYIKRSGEAVMGRGCAKRAANMFPKLPVQLGRSLEEYGNHVQVIATQVETPIVSFPVKPVSDLCNADKSNVVQHMQSKFVPDQLVPGWACTADLTLIARSALELVKLTEKRGWARVVVPRPGCGAGELHWNDVKKILDEILDERFLCITWRKDT